jgi:hypothetical protein
VAGSLHLLSRQRFTPLVVIRFLLGSGPEISHWPRFSGDFEKALKRQKAWCHDATTDNDRTGSPTSGRT